jgi:hypothetical protein
MDCMIRRILKLDDGDEPTDAFAFRGASSLAADLLRHDGAKGSGSRAGCAPHVWLCAAGTHAEAIRMYASLYCAQRRQLETPADAEPLLVLLDATDADVAEARKYAYERLVADGARAYSAVHITTATAVVSQFTLVLDLNGVLVDKLFDPERKAPASRYHVRCGAFAVTVRPGARAFVAWALEAFGRVVVWSSLRRENVDAILGAVFGGATVRKMHAVLGNEDSPRDTERPEFKRTRESRGGSASHSQANVAILKDLDFLAEKIGGCARDMVMVDDSYDKVRRHSAQALVPRSFTPHCHRDLLARDHTLMDVVKPGLLALCLARGW